MEVPETKITNKPVHIKARENLSNQEAQVMHHLSPIFPQLAREALMISVQHPSNKSEPYQEAIHLQNCIDDLLELRTYRSAAASVMIDSDEELEKSMVRLIENVESDSSSQRSLSDSSVTALDSPKPVIVVDSPKSYQMDKIVTSNRFPKQQLSAIPSPPENKKYINKGELAAVPITKSGSITPSSADQELERARKRHISSPHQRSASSPHYTHTVSIKSPLSAVRGAGQQKTSPSSTSTNTHINRANMVPGQSPPYSHPAPKTKSPVNVPATVTRSLPGASNSPSSYNQKLTNQSPTSAAVSSTPQQYQSATASTRYSPVVSSAVPKPNPPATMTTVKQVVNRQNVASTGPVLGVGVARAPSGEGVTRAPSGEGVARAPSAKSSPPSVTQAARQTTHMVSIDTPRPNPAASISAATHVKPRQEPAAVTERTQTNANTVPMQNKPKSPDDYLNEMVTEVTSCFPDVDIDYVKEQLRQHPNYMAVMAVCNQLLEMPSYPKQSEKKQPNKEATQTVQQQKPQSTSSCNYYEQYSDSVSSGYVQQCLALLQNDFKKVSVRDIRSISARFNYHYAPTRKCIMEALQKAGVIMCFQQDKENLGLFMKLDQVSEDKIVYCDVKNGSMNYVHKVKLLKCGRNGQRSMSCSQFDPLLQKEIEFIINQSKLEKMEKDHLLALQLNEDEYEEAGQMIECGCCFGDYMFESMVQCYEGHLFCQECLRNYAKEAVFGSGHAKLQCMTSGCEASFPLSQLKISLPASVLSQYEDRMQEESINLADLTDLVRCPFCDFAAILDPGDKVFTCQNASCLKQSCRHCKEDWKDHFGIPCEEIEKKDETKLRLAFEEKMTLAKIRTCHRCKTSFTKLDGCNKMTCRCGAKMCYICRAPNIDYKHFCQHVRDPGKPCAICKSCSLWTNPDEDDERAVREIQNKAQQARKDEGFVEEKMIGPPKEPPAKKPRMN